ncbi:MAG TPA: serine/threonine-protein phosphatase [bacterium]|nr:serine/threonine-protein phosphatase [bacterium]
MYHMKVSGQTDVGLVRNNNEDAFFIGDSMLIVADGMGGAAAGEIASNIAVETIPNELNNFSYTTDEEAVTLFRDSIHKADYEIKSQVEQNSTLEGMGTTIVAALYIDSRLLIGYVGDSRAYIITNPNAGLSKESNESPQINAAAETGVLQAFGSNKVDDNVESISRITVDHSVVMEMVNSGVILEEDIRTHPMRNRITRCLGAVGNSEPDFVWHDVSNGETLVMCSDGLWEMVHEDLILAIVNSSKSPDDICKRLITAAKNSGGSDNITVIAAMFEKE